MQVRNAFLQFDVLFRLCRIMEVLVGKGGGRKGRFQGKVSKLEKRGEAEELLRDHIKEQSS